VIEIKKWKARNAYYQHLFLNDLRRSIEPSHYIKFSILVRDEGPHIGDATMENLFIDLHADAKRICEGDLDLTLAHNLLYQIGCDMTIKSDKEKGTEINICCKTASFKAP
jgi:C4-dicarboxylate-specific signal transduction histidine kinase